MKNSETSTSSKVTSFLEKNAKVLLGIVAVLFVFVVVIVAGSSISAKATAKGITAVDEIDYTFRNDGSDLSDSDLAARQAKALEALEPLASKCGVVGLRANMLKADILFQQKDFEGSRAAWVKAAEAKKSAYTASIAYYNAAICSENLNDLDSAVKYFGKAVKNEDFLLIDHAYFSLGRVNEAKGDIEAATTAYEKVCDVHPNSKWADLAKSRVIAIKANSSKAE